MQFLFQPLVREVKKRPIVPFTFTKLPGKQLYGLVDSGSNSTWIDGQWAVSLGIDLSGVEEESVTIAAGSFKARKTDVSVKIDGFIYQARVGFVDDWTYGHQILGLQGFFDRFIVKVDEPKALVTLTPAKRLASN